MASLSFVDQIVAVGSIDGILTTAALLRTIGRPNEVGVVFTQAFEFDKIDPAAWEPNRRVAFVDLAVNNRNPQMTADFVRRLREAGHQLVAVIDEHSREDWLDCLVSFEDLAVEPQSQKAGVFKSSGAVLKAALDDTIDAHTAELLDSADAGDRMDFTTRFGGVVNQAVKAAIQDNNRRVYMARHFASQRDPDEKIRGWVAEYQEILANHAAIVAAKQDLGDGMIRVVATGKRVDMTTLLSGLYRTGVRVVVLEGEMFNPAKKAKEIMVSFATGDPELDLLAAIKAAGVNAGGFLSKANVDLADEAKATEAVRQLLRG